MNDEELLLEEHKSVQSYMLEAEKTFLNWERLFLLVNGILFGLSIQALTSTPPLLWLVILCGTLGATTSTLWLMIQRRSTIFTGIRHKRLRKIETLLRRKLPNDEYAFAMLMETDDFFKNEKLNIFDKVPVHRIRNFFPIIIVVFWIAYIFVGSAMLPLKAGQCEQQLKNNHNQANSADTKSRAAD